MLQDSDMYLITSKLYEKSDSDIYLMYFHIGMSNIMTSTCLEFYSLGKMDMVTRCILLLFGKGCIIYFLGNFFVFDTINYLLRIIFSKLFFIL